jgi:hypothetical protein
MSITIRPEAKRAFSEGGFEDGLQKGTDNFLSDPIPNRGDAQGAQIFAFTLGDVNPEKWCGVIMTAVLEVEHERVEVLLKVCLEHPKSDPIDTWGAAVALDGFEGAKHPSRINTSCEGVDLKALSSQRTFLEEKSICGRRTGDSPAAFPEEGRLFRGRLMSEQDRPTTSRCLAPGKHTFSTE